MIPAAPVSDLVPELTPAPLQHDPVHPTPRLAWVDVTRGLAIVGVATYHAQGFLGSPSTLQGQAGVDAFLMISGFGLAYSGRCESNASFLVRRLLRLLPAYWIVLTLCILCETLLGRPVGLKQILASFSCTHLFFGDEIGFAINMSFWFMGLIVPLYLVYSLIRPHLERRGYAFLGVGMIIAWCLGVCAVECLQDTRNSTVGHVAARIPNFFLGAAVGLAFRRRDTLDRLCREPLLLAGVVLLVPVSVLSNYSFFPFSILTGSGIVLMSMFVAAAGERSRYFRPLAALLTTLGLLAFEIYLVHQYLIVKAAPDLLDPILQRWYANRPAWGRQLTATLLALAASMPIAWCVRWIANPRASLRSWKPTLAVVAGGTVLLSGVAFYVPTALPRQRPRTFYLDVRRDAPPPATPQAEPICAFGHQGLGDIVLLQHDGQGQARVAVDHWGSPTEYTPWLPLDMLTPTVWTVTFDTSGILVETATGVRLRGPHPPHVPNARPVLGSNPYGFSNVLTESTTRVVRLAKAPAGAGAESPQPATATAPPSTSTAATAPSNR